MMTAKPRRVPGRAAPYPDRDIVGVDLQTAQDTVQSYGVFFSSSRNLAGTRLQGLDGNWQVCAHTPAAGTRVTGQDSDIEIDLAVVRREENCPWR